MSSRNAVPYSFRDIDCSDDKLMADSAGHQSATGKVIILCLLRLKVNSERLRIPDLSFSVPGISRFRSVFSTMQTQDVVIGAEILSTIRGSTHLAHGQSCDGMRNKSLKLQCAKLQECETCSARGRRNCSTIILPPDPELRAQSTGLSAKTALAVHLRTPLHTT